MGFYGAFIPIFLQIAAPLTDQTKKGEANKVRWGETQQNAFDALKKALVMRPILRMSDLSQPFISQVDASNDELGAVLLQEEEGKKSPVAYASRKLKTSEKAYAVIKNVSLWSGDIRNFTGTFMVQLLR